MRVNWPLVRRHLQRLRRRRAIEIKDLAARQWSLCAEERVAVRPALHRPGALERVSALSPWRNWETERLLIDGGPLIHAPSRAYLLERVDIVGAYLYAGAARDQAGYGAERWLLERSASVQRIADANLVSNFAGSQFFGHLLLDDFPRALIAEGDPANIAVSSKPYSHEPGYRDLCDVSAAQIVRRARVNRLILYSDFAQNSFKADRYRELRARVRAFVGLTVPPAGVFLRRGSTGERRELTNEAQIEAFLTARGFAIVDPSALSAQEIARRTLDAPIVVAVEGSHLSHGIYTVREGGAFCVLQPPDRFAMAYKEFTDRMEMDFAFVVGRPTEDGFSVDIDDLGRTLDLIRP